MSKLAKTLQAAAGNAGGDNLYVEDVFSTYLYTGNGSTQTITNDIDLDGEGGLVWLKDRLSASLGFHTIYDTEGGTGPNGGRIFAGTAGTNARSTQADGLQSFNSTGFTLGANTYENGSGKSFASWTFRKSPKFFDVVTWAGNNVGGRQIPHNLGSVPGMVIVKNTDASTSWRIWHRAVPGDTNDTSLLSFATSPAELNKTNIWAPNGMTDSYFTVSTTSPSNINETGYNYVAYVFAHNDAGGFGDDGLQNVISCGSYTGTGSSQTLNLGFEPQWILIKQSSGANDWNIWDNMRGLTVGGTDTYLRPNLAQAEDSSGSYDFLSPTATGVIVDPLGQGYNYVNTSGQTYIYIAIRRGPMKTPEAGTEVFAVNVGTSTGVTSSFTTDLVFPAGGITNDTNYIGSRLQGGQAMNSYNTGLEQNLSSNFVWDRQTGWGTNFDAYYAWMFKRAPSFMDVVAYTGTGSGTTVIHNLGVAPELIITKRRNSTSSWGAFHSFTPTQNGYNYLDLSGAGFNATYGTSSRAFQSQPTSTQFITGGQAQIDSSGGTYVAYLFATLAGVSKVGSYTGTGADLNVDCGFSAGARFILIKRTDGNGDWHYWDSVRGITNGNDPFLRYNSSAGQQTGTDLVEPLPSGFIVTGNGSDPGWDATNKLNSTYIFLAIS